MSLHDLLIQNARRTPHALAIKGPDGSMTYGELDRFANRFAHTLSRLGVYRGDRVGIWLEKSVCAVAAMQGVLRLGAVYVPLDPLNPAARVAIILRDCSVRAIVTTRARASSLQAVDVSPMACVCPDEAGRWYGTLALADDTVDAPIQADDEMAYILYTSGSTGKPKGVCISHRNALAFVEWAAHMLQARPDDRFASHAPFHFDLSVLDLYVAFLAGASVFLIPDGIAYLPTRLVNVAVQEQLTIWYSVPSVLVLMMEQGGLLEAAPSLRTILFAGEPFPMKHLRRLYERFPAARLLNLYGPTETNVCTFYEVQELQSEQTRTVPIGRACSGDLVWARKLDNSVAQAGEEGELMVLGPTVMLGYWGQPEHGQQAYATGDIVRLQEDGNYVYIGRLDQLVKVRGYRIELGEIEAALEAHPSIHEVAVVVSGSGMEAKLLAFVVSTADSAPSLLEIKRYCAEHLPRYMIVDSLSLISALPRTRNGKVDRLALTKGSLSAIRAGEK